MNLAQEHGKQDRCPVIAVALFASVLAVGTWIWIRTTEQQLETDLTTYLLTLPVEEWDQ